MADKPNSAATEIAREANANRYGLYRRHLAVEPDGRRHLCARSGCVVRPDELRGLDL
jgi:hypothetical protein